ncbi:MAG: DUF456 family protein [Phycisphaerales bacterium]
MTTTLSVLASVVFVVVGLVGVLLQAVTLPGIWLIVLGAVVYQGICTLAGQPLPFEWWTFILALVLGVLGEVVELVTCAIGAAAAGGSKRGAAGAILGSVVGALAGIFVFAFIPILGPLIGALLGAAAGALAGELSYGDRTLRQSWLPAVGAAVGRVAGAVAKFGLACVIFLMLAIDAFV